MPDENGSLEPLRKYTEKTLVIVLPGELTIFDIGLTFLAFFCLSARHLRVEMCNIFYFILYRLAVHLVRGFFRGLWPRADPKEPERAAIAADAGS